MAKFVGEAGHDAGGLYTESLVAACRELQAVNEDGTMQMPLLVLCPNGRNQVGEQRDKFLPNPCFEDLEMFEFLGRLMGICSMDTNRALPLDLPSIVWYFLYYTF